MGEAGSAASICCHSMNGLKKRLDRSTRRILVKAHKQLPSVLHEIQQRVEIIIETFLQMKKPAIWKI